MPQAPLWRPAAARAAASGMSAFAAAYAAHLGRAPFASYADMHRASVQNSGAFWRFYLQYSGLPFAGDDPARPAVSAGPMWTARWFEGTTTNYARALLHPPWPGAAEAQPVPDAQPAIIALTESGARRNLTYGDLRAQTAAAAAALQQAGVQRGDRVAAIIGNVPEAVILLCACAAIGAVFSSCSPDFGADAAIARFGQISPKLLFAQPAYNYNGKRHDITAAIRRISAATCGGAATVYMPDALGGAPAGAALWQEWLAPHAGAAPVFAEVPFDHPLYVLYSSGTTGAPKAIVHRTGGAMLKHHSEHALHCDIGAGDTVLYFTTCGWMMWNWLASALMRAATIVLYEGSPAHPAPDALWRAAANCGATFAGASAGYIQSCRAARVSMPADSMTALKTVASTGSPLSPAGFEWIYASIKQDVHVASISGGTDIVGCFMLGNPNLPVLAGQIQCPAMGVDVCAADENGAAIQDAPGELLCRAPFPSMPLGFWGDADHSRYRAAYFSHFPNQWRHGDLVTFHAGGGIVVHGRSDATLNPGGVRIGSADIYRPLEQLPEITDAAAVGKKTGDEDGAAGAALGDEEIWLFVVLGAGAQLDDALRARIAAAIRASASPRHVPRRIFAVPDLPRTRSGKTTELAISALINNRPIPNRAIMANPQALEKIGTVVSSQ